MPVIDEKSSPELFLSVKDRNIEAQYFLLETAFSVASQLPNFRFSLDVVNALHYVVANFIDHTPGQIRDGFVSIQNSPHTPPPADQLRHHLDEFFEYLNTKFHTHTSAHLAAYALWRLTWIHPYFDCNGRTARAYCLFVFCLKEKFWIPGKRTVLAQIRTNIDKLYAILQECDQKYMENGEFYNRNIENYIKEMFIRQAKS